MASVRSGANPRTAVVEAEASESPPYATAIFKLALRLKRREDPRLPDWDRLVDLALGQALGGPRESGIDRVAFRGYLERNYSFLLASLGQRHS
jgi:hypothetical protein